MIPCSGNCATNVPTVLVEVQLAMPFTGVAGMFTEVGNSGNFSYKSLVHVVDGGRVRGPVGECGDWVRWGARLLNSPIPTSCASSLARRHEIPCRRLWIISQPKSCVRVVNADHSDAWWHFGVWNKLNNHLPRVRSSSTPPVFHEGLRLAIQSASSLPRLPGAPHTANQCVHTSSVLCPLSAPSPTQMRRWCEFPDVLCAN